MIDWILSTFYTTPPISKVTPTEERGKTCVVVEEDDEPPDIVDGLNSMSKPNKSDQCKQVRATTVYAVKRGFIFQR